MIVNVGNDQSYKHNVIVSLKDSCIEQCYQNAEAETQLAGQYIELEKWFTFSMQIWAAHYIRWFQTRGVWNSMIELCFLIRLQTPRSTSTLQKWHLS